MENLLQDLTLESLPKAFIQLSHDVTEIKALLLQKKSEPSNEIHLWLNLTELCAYHPDKPAKPTVYAWVNAGLIPVHKNGKKLRFLKSEIDSWLLRGKRQTVADIQEAANHYLTKKKK